MMSLDDNEYATHINKNQNLVSPWKETCYIYISESGIFCLAIIAFSAIFL